MLLMPVCHCYWVVCGVRWVDFVGWNRWCSMEDGVCTRLVGRIWTDLMSEMLALVIVTNEKPCDEHV